MKINVYLCSESHQVISREPDELGWKATEKIQCWCGRNSFSCHHPFGVQEFKDMAVIEFFKPLDQKEVKKAIEELLPKAVITFGMARDIFEQKHFEKVFIYRLIK